jgi:F-type H+-transporting ATPase subunit b
MPQFDVATFPAQLFWLAVMFVTLYTVMVRLAIPRISEVLDERQRRIDADLERAQQLKADADLAISRYERALADSRAQAHVVMKDAAERLARQAEARNKELSQRLADQIKAGEARIHAAKDQALSHVREVAADVAAATVAKLVGTAPDRARLDAAITAAMQEQPR